MTGNRESIRWYSFWGLIGAALISSVIYYYVAKRSDSGMEFVAGTVIDAVNNKPLDRIVVKLEADDGRVLRQDSTDVEGKFNLEIPNDISVMRLLADKDGYIPYEVKMPARPTKINIPLKPFTATTGVPENAALDAVLERDAATLNVTVVFSTSCSSRARHIRLHGGNIDLHPEAPELTFEALLSRVKDSNLRYKVIALGQGGRYEISCY